MKHNVIKFYVSIENEILSELKIGEIDIEEFATTEDIFEKLKEDFADELFIRYAEVESIKIDWINTETAYLYDCGELIGCIETQG